MFYKQPVQFFESNLYNDECFNYEYIATVAIVYILVVETCDEFYESLLASYIHKFQNFT